jgi:hypothetical protein
MKITLPKGFQLPAAAKPGEPFESVATLTISEDGTVQLSALDGVTLPEAEEPEQEEMQEPDITIPFEPRGPAPMV